ncbi:ribosome maturation factor RimM [soil metagenome]
MAGGTERRIVVARIGAAHGIRGEVRVKSFTAAPLDAVGYGPLDAPDGRSFTVRSARAIGPEMLVVHFTGIADRNTAETLNGLDLSVPRAALPAAGEEEFYHADLIGLAAVGADGGPLGTIVAVPNYGAGDLLEIAPPAGLTLLIPFTRAAVPEIDIAAGKVVVVPPSEVGEDEP